MKIKKINLKLAKKEFDNLAEYWLLRHGKTPHNKPDEEATFAGGKVDDQLSDEGKIESKNLAEEIVEKCVVDLIATSHMSRSKETGKIIASKYKELKNKNIPIVEIDDLHEVDVGDFTGHTEKEAREMDSKAAEAFYSGNIEKWNFPGGEDYVHLVKRIKNVVNQMKKLSKGNVRILVIGHGMFNRMINYYLAKDQEDLWRSRSYPHDQVVIYVRR
jgi:broad specificity phosphatase PhoE